MVDSMITLVKKENIEHHLREIVTGTTRIPVKIRPVIPFHVPHSDGAYVTPYVAKNSNEFTNAARNRLYKECSEFFCHTITSNDNNTPCASGCVDIAILKLLV